jgi:NTE family protein
MANFDYNRMIEVWEKINNEEIYGSGADRYKADKLGIFSLHDIYQKISKEVTLSEIRESRIQGYATAAKIKKESLVEQLLLHRMKREVFHLNNFKDPHKAVLASSSIPIIFGSTKIGDEVYVDGGAIDNCPLEPLIDAGCDIIFTVPLHSSFKAKKYEKNDVLIINFHSNYHFGLISDVLDFKPTIVEEKAEYGYLIAKYIITKLQELNIMEENYNIMKPEGFYVVEIEKDEEKELRGELDGS